MLALRAIASVFRAIFTTKADLMVENLALRQQLNVLRRKSGRPWLRKQDRVFWLWLALVLERMARRPHRGQAP